MNMFRKLDDLMMDPYLDEDFYREMAEYFLDRTDPGRQTGRGRRRRDRDRRQHGDQHVGPRFFERFVLDYERRLIAAIHQLGVPVIYHNCGDAAKIMHLYNRLETDVWGYLTPPPFGDVDLDEALRVIRPDIVLRGNIDQVEFLVKATPERGYAGGYATSWRRSCHGGISSLSTTDFFFDGTPYENIAAFAEAGRQYGIYSVTNA